MTNIIKTEKEDFLRDNTNNALINTNVTAYQQYRNQRESQKKVMNIEGEVDSLKKDVTDIKEMLMILIKQNSKEN
jgi:hypothetical protein